MPRPGWWRLPGGPLKVFTPGLPLPWLYLGASKNRGTPKSSILIGFSLINQPFWGPTPIFGNTHLRFETLAQNGCFLALVFVPPVLSVFSSSHMIYGQGPTSWYCKIPINTGAGFLHQQHLGLRICPKRHPPPRPLTCSHSPLRLQAREAAWHRSTALQNIENTMYVWKWLAQKLSFLRFSSDLNLHLLESSELKYE